MLLNNRFTHSSFLLPVLILGTVIACFPVLQNGWVNWDDPDYVLNNVLLSDRSFDGFLKLITTLQVQGMYHPLTLMSLAFDKLFANNEAWFYHGHNLLLHLVNTALVYWFIRKVVGQNLTAGITAILFGIHPMHVESVAWISERKDVLYACYFLLALISWQSFIKTVKHRKFYYIATIAFFTLSLFAKPMAITLPIALLLLDYLFKRTSWTKCLLEKLPFFVLSSVFGVVAIIAQQNGGAMGVVDDLRWTQTIFVGTYGLLIYLVKTVIPIQLSAFHPYPEMVSENWPWYIYASCIPIVGMFVLLGLKFRNNRKVVFGVLFFVVTILPVLQVLSVGKAIVAERYTYVPYIGLLFLLALIWQHFSGQNRTAFSRNISNSILILFLVMMMGLSNARARVWLNNITLWTDVVKKYPESHLAYCNRATTYGQSNELTLSLQDCNDCIRLQTDLYESYNNRGLVHIRLGNYDSALGDFTDALGLNPEYKTALANRAALYMDLGNLASAFLDFNQLKALDKADANTRYNLAVVYGRLSKFDDALHEISRAIELEPSAGQYFLLRSQVYRSIGNLSLAEKDLLKSQQLNYQTASN